MNRGNRLRLFVAIDLPEELRMGVSALRQDICGMRWTRSEQLHVTLRFLGPTPEAKLEEICESLSQVRAPYFDLNVKGLGIFPPVQSRKPPRVLWLGLQPERPLCELRAELDRVLGPDAEMVKQGYSPHLTLARFTSRPMEDFHKFVASHTECEIGTWRVDRFHVYHSTLQREGALHEVVRSYSLDEPCQLK
jgi:2'-5' RNA ligase